MRRLVVVFLLVMGVVSSANARYLDPGITYASNRFIVQIWPQSRDLSPLPTLEGETAVLADLELTQLNKKWGVEKVERLFPAGDAKDYRHSEELSTYWRFVLGSGEISEALLGDFAKASVVAHIEPVGIHQVCYQPDDPAYANQWYLQATAEDHDVDAPEAWNLQRGEAAAIIGILDTGVQYEHPDLSANIWSNQAEQKGVGGYDDDGNGYVDDYRGWDFIVYEMVWPGEDGRYQDNSPTDFVGHGTHIAGIAAAVTNNATGVSGIAGGGAEFSGARLMPLRIGWLGANGNAYVAMDYAAQAIEYGRQKGVTAFTCAWTSSNSGGLGAAVDEAIIDNIIFCVAAGNSNNDNPYYLNTRGDCIDIAAVDGNDVKTSVSNYGTWVDICAPGQSIYSTYSDHYTNTYAYDSGTSMTTGMVAGVVALIKSHQPDWTRDEITAALLAGVDDIYNENPDYIGLLGEGRLNLHLALLNTGSCQIVSPNGGEVWVTGDTATVIWESETMEGEVVLSLNRDFPDGEWEDIYIGTPDADSLNLLLTGLNGPHARLRIASVLAPSVCDSSDDDFLIDFPQGDPQPIYSFKKPKGGEELLVGDRCLISWSTSSSSGTVTLSINRDFPDGPWEDIFLQVEDQGSILWEIEGSITTNARLRITSDEYPTSDDITDGDFTITFRKNAHLPIFDVLTPDGGELWYTGMRHTIIWSCEGECDSVRIMLCENYPGEPCETIAIVRNAFEWGWIVSGKTTTNARIIVSCFGNRESMGVSDEPFSIMSGPETITTIENDDIILHWRPTGAPYYRVYSSSKPTGSFSTLEVVTADTLFLDEGALQALDKKFYQVVSMAMP